MIFAKNGFHVFHVDTIFDSIQMIWRIFVWPSPTLCGHHTQLAAAADPTTMTMKNQLIAPLPYL